MFKCFSVPDKIVEQRSKILVFNKTRLSHDESERHCCRMGGSLAKLGDSNDHNVFAYAIKMFHKSKVIISIAL